MMRRHNLIALLAITLGLLAVVTADGIVLSQWHVSHWRSSDDGDGLTIRPDSSPTSSAGERTTVILHDGRECPAELLGADRSQDISLLQLLDPGPYPHAPIHATVPIEVGDFVLKIGHAMGFREGRSAPVRLGRVIAGNDTVFGTDCGWSGGDSGGPYFTLDGQLVGIMRGSNPTLLSTRHDATFQRRTDGLNMSDVSGSRFAFLLPRTWCRHLNKPSRSFRLSDCKSSWTRQTC